MSGTAWINEVHYDNVGTDTGEAIEIAGRAGTDLSGWSLVLYNGNGGASYNPRTLAGVIPNQDDGFGTLGFSYPVDDIQNGAPDGIALVNGTTLVQFLSYEGSFTAVGGPAAGQVGTDIGVAETSATPAGFSLQLGGTGDSYEDFTWAGPGDDNFGAVNTGQDFTGSGQPAILVSGSPLAIAEGGADGSITVALATRPTSDVTVTLTVPADISASGTTLTFTPANFAAAQPVTLSAVDDTEVEGAETATINLAVASTDPAYNGLTAPEVTANIADNDIALTEIAAIQGAAHVSPVIGQVVRTSGVVTARDSNGFYLEDPTPDNDLRTSEAIFVFTGGQPPANVAVGAAVSLSGTVAEFTPGGAGSANLSTTQLTSPADILVTSTGNPLPVTAIGPGGRLPPTELIEDDSFTSFAPATDGADFFESLEGMRVTVQAPVAVGPTTGFGEIYTAVSAPGGGLNATNVSERGTLNIEGGTGDVNVTNLTGGDFNPERVQVDDDPGGVSGSFRASEVATGAQLSDVTGVVSYGFGNYEVLATSPFTVTQPSALAPEVSTLQRGADQLLVATYNVLNLDPNDADGSADVADGQFAEVAGQVVRNLNSPDIVALQEIQDNSGSADDATTAADLTLRTLVEAIAAAGGPRYEFLDNPFIGDDTSGGEPGGNIRTAFLYNPARVDFVEGSLRTVTDPRDQQTNPDNPFFDARLPLAADFQFGGTASGTGVFGGETVTVVANHFTSKGGSDPLFGRDQLPENGGEEKRAAQAQLVNDFADGLLAAEPGANAVVAGDLNEFEFEEPLQVLEGDLRATGYSAANGGGVTISEDDALVLTNLTFTLPEDERYSYIFEGNSQSLDHILVSDNLAGRASFDAVHVNSEFPNVPSDHDPLLARLDLAGQALAGGNGGDGLTGGGFADTLRGGNGEDTVSGGGAGDLLQGNNGDDLLSGGFGRDILSGDNGADTLAGGAGGDLLTGGNGPDRFLFAPGGGADWITDFAAGGRGGGNDRLVLQDGISITGPAREEDVNGDGRLDLVLALTDGGSVALLGVNGISDPALLIG